MHASTKYIAGALLLAAAAPAVASPAQAGFAAGGKVDIGPIHAEAAIGAEVDLSLCQKRADIAIAGNVKVGCNFFSTDFSARMKTPAHIKYEVALEIYHDVLHLTRHTLMTRGLERLKRLIQIAALVKEAEDILIVADILNANDERRVRKSWINHEINHLRAKLGRARWISMHLPNLCLAEDIFHFAVDTSVAVVEFAVGATVAVGAAVVIGVHEAIHLVARAFHYMGKFLHWAVDEIIEAFLWLRKKLHDGASKVGKWIHKVGHEVKEGLEDGVSIIVDILHHAGHHHKCHRTCANTGVVVVVGEDKCDCGNDDGYATVTEVCVVQEKICTREEYTETIVRNYNVELSWTEEVAHTKVKETVTEINAAIGGLSTELVAIQAQVARADFD